MKHIFNTPIFLDYATTTPMLPEVIKKMIEFLLTPDLFGNPSSSNYYGNKTKIWLNQAKREITKLIGASKNEIFWTSGATESINAAIKGFCLKNKNRGNHIITFSTEHLSVLNTCKFLKKEGFQLSILTANKKGRYEIKTIKKAIKKNTILISIMHVNNEIGIIQNIEEIAKYCKKKEIAIHIDGTQSIGKLKINLKNTNIDFFSFSLHKIYGPKGIGVLYINKEIQSKIYPFIHGGGQQKGFRGGTLATHQIVGAGEAAKFINLNFQKINKKIMKLYNLMFQHLSINTNIIFNGDLKNKVPHITSITVKNIIQTKFLEYFNNIAFSQNAACSIKNDYSHVLNAMKIKKSMKSQTIRISIGLYTTQEEILYFCNKINKTIIKLLNL